MGFSAFYSRKRLYLYNQDLSFTNLIQAVDGMASCSNNQETINWVKNFLKQTFKGKILGQLCSFIAWEMAKMTSRVHLGHSKYAERLLEKSVQPNLNLSIHLCR